MTLLGHRVLGLFLLLLLANVGGSAHAHATFPPYFSAAVGTATSTGFNVTSRAGLPELTLLKGGEGTVQVVVTSNLNTTQNFALVLTLDHTEPPRQLTPPGVTFAFRPSNITVPSNSNGTVLLIIRADTNAPVGAYPLYLSSAVEEAEPELSRSGSS